LKKLFVIALLAFGLAACTALKNIETAIQLGTASTANPVTKDRLNQMESAAILVFSGLKVWKTSCSQGLIPPSCYDQIAGVQVYTSKIKPYLAQLRTFVKTNDQVNATIIWNQVLDVIATVKAQAAANGVPISTVNVGS
jgi:hypothetical protein